MKFTTPRILAAIMVVAMLSLTACSEKEAPSSSTVPSSSETTEQSSSETPVPSETLPANSISSSTPPSAPSASSAVSSEPPASSQSEAPPMTPSSSVVESAPAGSASVSILCVYGYDGEQAEKSFTDAEAVDAITAYFQNLTESAVEMTPKMGGVVFTVTINDNENTTSYRFNAPQRDGTLYCKNVSATEWTAMTGWLQLPDTGVYDYVESLFSEYLG